MRSWTRLGLALGLLVPLTGCFSELFFSRTVYLATEYRIEHPRIVGMAVDPPRIEPGRTYTLEALYLAPAGQDPSQVRARTCGLGREVPTFIFDLNCFQEPDEVQELVTGDSFRLQFQMPETPLVEGCGIQLEGDIFDTATLGIDTALQEGPCAHELPLLLEATVDDTPVLAASFDSWYTGPLDQELPASAWDLQFAMPLPESASPGEELTLTAALEGDQREAEFIWYIDDGELEKTGWTVAQGYTEEEVGWTGGRTTTDNIWVTPSEPGSYRVAVVARGIVPAAPDAPWPLAANNHWVVGTVEVR